MHKGYADSYVVMTTAFGITPFETDKAAYNQSQVCLYAWESWLFDLEIIECQNVLLRSFSILKCMKKKYFKYIQCSKNMFC